MTGRRWLVWGARGHTLVVADLAALVGAEIVLLADNDPDATPPLPATSLVHELAGLDLALAERAPTDRPDAFVVAIGGGRGRDRLAIHDALVARGLAPATLVHPAAHVAASATLGDGCQVLAGAVVGAGAVLGRQCIVNTSASVDHGCTLADGVHVGPGATLAGQVVVEAAAFVGAGATVVPNVVIGADATVGAGAVVTGDVAAGLTVVGVPARPLDQGRPLDQTLRRR